MNFDFWQILFFFLTAGAISFLLTGLFARSGRHADRLFFSGKPPRIGQELLNSLSLCVNSAIVKGGKAELLNNGEEFVPAIFSDLKNAQKYINFTTYLWKKGRFSDDIFNILEQKQKSGVQVRILLDGLVWRNVPHSRFKNLQKFGAIIKRFRAPAYGRLTHLHRRSHRRAIVIDGKVGYVGGMCVHDNWLGNGRGPNSWRDSMTRLSGPLASTAQAAFSQLWITTSGEILTDPECYLDSNLPPETTMKSINVVSSPALDSEPLPKLIWLSLACAEQRIRIETPYFIPETPIKNILLELAKKKGRDKNNSTGPTHGHQTSPGSESIFL